MQQVMIEMFCCPQPPEPIEKQNPTFPSSSQPQNSCSNSPQLQHSSIRATLDPEHPRQPPLLKNLHQNPTKTNKIRSKSATKQRHQTQKTTPDANTPTTHEQNP
ncbi:hypothetical protein M758_9G057100 [Ceratodon purpureus]|nr:hypothetical protein M758_9G057100 [Ceratodon purpureus]